VIYPQHLPLPLSLSSIISLQSLMICRWAWQNPHITLHIPPESRIQHATQKKRSGQPKRPRHSVASLLSNLHLLLRVPSFSRWPLELRFFSENVYKAWLKWCNTAAEPIRNSIKIIQDFPTSDTTSDDVLDSPRTENANPPHGIITLAVDYSKEKPHVEKGKNIVEFEREGACAICHSDLEHDAGFYTVCPNLGCESVTHLTCLSQHFLKDEEDELVPVKGQCPTCKAEIRWANVVRELSLRLRGQKEVEKLLKGKRARKGKAVTASEAGDIEDEEDDDDDDELVSEIELLPEREFAKTDTIMGDTWHEIDTSDDSDTESIISNKSKAKQAASYTGTKAIGLKTVIEDTDSEAEILD
jgi:structure-specific endonuclease subunit SLX1